jgi:hypothetical protein
MGASFRLCGEGRCGFCGDLLNPTSGVIGLGYDRGEATVGQEGVGGPSHTDQVVAAGFVAEGSPLGGLVVS